MNSEGKREAAATVETDNLAALVSERARLDEQIKAIEKRRAEEANNGLSAKPSKTPWTAGKVGSSGWVDLRDADGRTVGSFYAAGDFKQNLANARLAERAVNAYAAAEPRP